MRYKLLFVLIVFFCSIIFVNGQSIKVTKVITKDSVHLNYINPYLAPIELKISALDSTKNYIKFKPFGLIRYNDTLKNALVIPRNKIKDTSKINSNLFIKFKGTFGDSKSKIIENYEYTLPYPKGKKYKIIQSFGGKFSHNLPHSRYAIDFGLKIGDTITAARDGIVFFVKEDSDEFCKNKSCINKGNKVLILHNDGTMAHYVHLQLNGALVKVGDKVEVGQPIAICGMTGFTTIPHLHFVVYKSGSISIPYRFKNQRHKKLKPGKKY